MKKVIIVGLMLFALSLFSLLSACSVIKNKDVVKDLYMIVEDIQKSYVWPGGTPYNDCYTNRHKEKFLKENHVQDIRNGLMNNRKFVKSVIELNKEDPDDVADLLSKLREHRAYKTWREIGRICNEGTTEAGSQVELTINSAIVDFIEELLSTDEDKIKIILEKQNSL